jgi:hypothetical protein
MKHAHASMLRLAAELSFALGEALDDIPCQVRGACEDRLPDDQCTPCRARRENSALHSTLRDLATQAGQVRLAR